MDVATRWNSTFAMLQRLLEQTSCIVAVISDDSCSKAAVNTLKNYVFTMDEHTLVEKVVKVLEPFLKATNILCAEKNPTMQKVIPVIMKLKKCIKIDEEDPDAIKTLKLKMISELESRTQDTEIAMMACMLNPYTKNLDFLETDQRVSAHSCLLKEALACSSNGLVINIKTEPGQDSGTDVVPQLPVLNHNSVEVDQNRVEIKSPCKKFKSDMDDWLQDLHTQYLG